MPSETAEKLRARIARMAELATGVPEAHWGAVMGAIVPTAGGWRVRKYLGDPSDNAIVRRLEDEVARHWSLRESPAVPLIAADRSDPQRTGLSGAIDHRSFWSA